MDPVCCCARCGGACGRLATVMEGGRALCELCRIEIQNQCGWLATRRSDAMCETETPHAKEAFDLDIIDRPDHTENPTRSGQEWSVEDGWLDPDTEARR